MQGFDQHLQEPSTTPATKHAPGLPRPETKWASFKTAPQIQATQVVAAPLTQPPWGMIPPSTQPLWGVAPPLIQPSGAGLENASPGLSGDTIPRSEAAVSSTPPLPELELALEYILAMDTRDASRERQNHYPPVEHCNTASIATLTTALPDSV